MDAPLGFRAPSLLGKVSMIYRFHSLSHWIKDVFQ